LWYGKRDNRPQAMPDFLKLPTWANKACVCAVVETPRGSRAKLEFDPKLGAFTLAKPLSGTTRTDFSHGGLFRGVPCTPWVFQISVTGCFLMASWIAIIAFGEYRLEL
jgi:hypothetical protein